MESTTHASEFKFISKIKKPKELILKIFEFNYSKSIEKVFLRLKLPNFFRFFKVAQMKLLRLYSLQTVSDAG